MTVPTFDTIPAIQNRIGIRFGTVTVSGVSTQHGSTHTDNGRLYGSIIRGADSVLSVLLFSDYEKTRLFLSGTAPANAPAAPSLNRFGRSNTIVVELAGAAGIQATGKATIIDPTGAAPIVAGGEADAILIVALSLDADVFSDVDRAENMPGYDPDYGLAAFHARAARTILLNDLPAAMPYIFAAGKVSPFVPLAPDAELPDLTKIESAESLRNAAATLARAYSAEEAEYTAEFAAMAAAARRRYAEIMAGVTQANAPATETATLSTTKGIQIAEWKRG